MFSRLHAYFIEQTQVVLTGQGHVNPAIRCKDFEIPHCERKSGMFEMVCKSLFCTKLDLLKPPQVKRTMR